MMTILSGFEFKTKNIHCPNTSSKKMPVALSVLFITVLSKWCFIPALPKQNWEGLGGEAFKVPVFTLLSKHKLHGGIQNKGLCFLSATCISSDYTMNSDVTLSPSTAII